MTTFIPTVDIAGIVEQTLRNLAWHIFIETPRKCVTFISTEYPIIFGLVSFVLVWNLLVCIAIIRKIFGTVIHLYLSQLLTTLVILMIGLVITHLHDVVPIGIELLQIIVPVVVLYYYLGACIRVVRWALF